MRDPLASARAMDQARTAGLPDELLAVHLAIVAARRGLTPWPPTPAVRAYVDNALTRTLDELAWVAARDHLTDRRGST